MNNLLRTSISLVKATHSFWVALVAVWLLGGCSIINDPVGEDDRAEAETTYVAFDVRAAVGTTTLAGEVPTTTDPEMRINTLRILIFDHATGAIRYNLMLAGALVTQQVLSPDAAWHGGFEMKPGTYDFFFVANEQVGHASMQAALAAIQNRSELFSNPALTRYPLTQAEFEGTAPAMVMTQNYENVTVAERRNGKGGTISDPQHFYDKISGTERISLVRVLAKTELIVENTIKRNTAGKYFFTLRRMPQLRTLTLVNLPDVSLFGTPYFTTLAQTYTAGYYTPTITTHTHVVQNFLGGNGRLRGEVDATNVLPGTTPPLFSYRTIRYIPELLRAANTAETQENLKLPTALSYHFNNATTNYYTISIDHREFNQLTGTTYVTPSGQTVSIKDTYTIPTPELYSRYSVLRNTHYKILAREEGAELRLTYVVEPWDFVILKPAYLGHYFNVWIEDCSFAMSTQKVRIVTSMGTVPPDHNIELRPLSGNSFNQTAVHSNRTYQSESNYTFTTATGLAQGTPMFAIYYNGNIVATITKGSVDCSLTTP